MNTMADTKSSNKLLMAVFWLYVLVPLAWGVTNTLIQAMKLFG
ncbi:MFS transporter small subunit [Paraburkholderia dinghuensis]|uniref:Oxalate:formate antiporter n=1 Tax=Paraburkholderia dinghuensis TaxID=2305225 RepID=A0A3N6N456_9BURK|nr:oxalate:formate antiporter [Paraburkholderia dinghuensis]RQH03692.1 oxalate:formate antiporter [Paraburkholderia dinghuensis]